MADVVSVLTGNFYSESGSIDPIFKEFSEGVSGKKKLVDRY